MVFNGYNFCGAVFGAYPAAYAKLCKNGPWVDMEVKKVNKHLRRFSAKKMQASVFRYSKIFDYLVR